MGIAGHRVVISDHNHWVVRYRIYLRVGSLSLVRPDLDPLHLGADMRGMFGSAGPPVAIQSLPGYPYYQKGN